MRKNKIEGKRTNFEVRKKSGLKKMKNKMKWYQRRDSDSMRIHIVRRRLWL